MDHLQFLLHFDFGYLDSHARRHGVEQEVRRSQDSRFTPLRLTG